MVEVVEDSNGDDGNSLHDRDLPGMLLSLSLELDASSTIVVEDIVFRPYGMINIFSHVMVKGDKDTETEARSVIM